MSEYLDIGFMIREMSGGKNEAWSYFLKKYERLMYHCINKVVMKFDKSILQEDREDCFQEVLRILLENNCKRLKEIISLEEKSFRSWIGMVSTRTALNFFYRMKRMVQLPEEILALIPDKSFNLDNVDLRREISDIIHQKMDSREALVILYFLDGLTLAETAELMEISLTTAYNTKERAISIIKRYLGEKEISKNIKVKKKETNVSSYLDNHKK